MSIFQYEAMNSVGQVVKGEVDAASKRRGCIQSPRNGTFSHEDEGAIREKVAFRSLGGGKNAGQDPPEERGKSPQKNS